MANTIIGLNDILAALSKKKLSANKFLRVNSDANAVLVLGYPALDYLEDVQASVSMHPVLGSS